jgi:hypothetical protein
MTLQVVFWLIVAGWAVAAVLSLIQLAFGVLAADARGARLSTRSLLPALRNPVRFGVVCTSVVVFSAIFQAINETWDLSFKPFSYDLTAYSGTAKQVVLVAGVWMCSAIVFTFVDRLLDKILPNGPDQPNADGGRQEQQGVANGT